VTKTDPKKTVLAALERARGDDLARARIAFRNRTPAQMQEQYGLSGKTCAQIVAEYEEHEAEINEAIAWVKART
jgi:hypothetical protein